MSFRAKKNLNRSGLRHALTLSSVIFLFSLCVALSFLVLMSVLHVWSQQDETFYLQTIHEQIKHAQVEIEARPRDPRLLTKLAGLYLNLGAVKQGSIEQRISFHEQGAQLAKRALTIQETLADAHFYYAANLGSATQLKGMMASAFVVQELKSHANRALELQHDHVPALHMLGRIFDELPWFLGGDEELALQYMERAVAIDEHDVHVRLDLAKLYIKRDHVHAAKRELEKIVTENSQKQDWMWKRYYQPEATELLTELQSYDDADQE